MSELQVNFGALGMDLEQSLKQLQKGKLTYAINAMIEGFDGQYVNYQNEQGNEPCITFPTGYKPIGIYTIYEQNKVIYFLVNSETGGSEIGESSLEDCTYKTVINALCLNFSIDHPILSVAHRSDNCATQIFWVDGYNKDRWLDFSNLPYTEILQEGSCDNTYTQEIDCNKLCINPTFNIPTLTIESVDGDGTLVSGTYQFAIQYCNSSGQGYTSYYSLTNPVPIFDVDNVTRDFNASVNKSIKVSIEGLDNLGYYDYYNIAVVKTINQAVTVDLISTRKITGLTDVVVYTGQSIEPLAIDDIYSKLQVYTKSNDLTVANDILIRDQLVSADRLNYQEIASQITIQWQSYKVSNEFDYSDELLAVDLRGYMRDEVYAFEIVFLLNDGRETDRFHIPGRLSTPTDLVPVWNNDAVNPDLSVCEDQEPLPRWKVYNTATVLGNDPYYIGEGSTSNCYKGPFEYGEMSYWESESIYPCNPELWGNLAGQKIRHHKMPDCLVSPIHDDSDNIYPLGIKVSSYQIQMLIANSNLTGEQKAEIVGFKIVRANRANSKSIVAKGIIHNVGTYTKEDNTYFYPNYPYNDRRDDPFISASGTATDVEAFADNSDISTNCNTWALASTGGIIVFNYIDCNNDAQTVTVTSLLPANVCAVAKPTIAAGDAADASIQKVDLDPNPCIPPSGTTPTTPTYTSFNGFISQENKKRFTFHSPDTHFYKPFLGNVLKLETIEYGTSMGHFVQTKNHSKYKLFANNLYTTALGFGVAMGFASGMYGVSTRIFDGVAFMTTYQTLVAIFERVVPKINYVYEFHSAGYYNKTLGVPNNGNKQRYLDIALYIQPSMVNARDIHPINNYQRESSVYLRATNTLPFTDEAGAPADESRWLPTQCDSSALNSTRYTDISSYYASIKKPAANQYGEVYSYDSVDTGTQVKFASKVDVTYVFGGDVFINRFAYKSKLTYFTDNRVDASDESDIFYNEIGNIGNPNYWFSLDSTGDNGKIKLLGLELPNLFGTPVTSLHCPKTAWAYKKGRMYLFSYGVPYFFCESEVNVDLRQAYNDKEGDFYPHVGSEIPDDWMQDTLVPFEFDNTYYYNKTYSKQNTDHFFSFLPNDYFAAECAKTFPFRAIFSEPSGTDPLSTFNNNWLIYKPSSYFDFPQNMGALISLDGIDYRQVLARFENRTQIYNALLTAPTSSADVYLGQPLFSSDTPPIDLAVTDQGFIGTRHKFLLRTEFGIVSVDDKRGQVFLINGRQPKNLTTTGSGVEQFFNKNLEVKLPKYVPGVSIDNTFNGVGITGVYDAKYDRLILTKLDYIPNVEGITYSNGKFYHGQKEVTLTDETYFCNRSFTISYDFATQSWISFHSYMPSYYIGASNFFLSGVHNQTWKHLTPNNFCSFYGEQAPYILEYPYTYEFLDEILQSVQDYSKTLQYDEDFNFIEVDDVYFNKVILYNNQQCSGILKLAKKPKNNLNEYMKYPIYSTDSKTILYTKSDNFYKINQFWSLVKDLKQPIFKKSCQALSFDKELNQANMDYSKMSFKKAPLRAKDLKCRFILDDRTDTRIVSQLLAIQSQKSFK